MDNESNNYDLTQWWLDAGITDPAEQPLYRGVTAEEVSALGFGQPTAGVLISYKDLDGKPMTDLQGRPYLRLRHHDDQRPADARRYSSRPDSGTHLFFPRLLHKHLDHSDYVLITEGEKKASMLSCRGEPAVSVPGWTCWRTPATDDLHADWRQLPLQGRIVHVVPDADMAFNADGHREIPKLALALYAAGAKDVKLVMLPPVSDRKLGVDDYLLADGTRQVRPLLEGAELIVNHPERCRLAMIRFFRESCELFKDFGHDGPQTAKDFDHAISLLAGERDTQVYDDLKTALCKSTGLGRRSVDAKVEEARAKERAAQRERQQQQGEVGEERTLEWRGQYYRQAVRPGDGGMAPFPGLTNYTVAATVDERGRERVGPAPSA